MVVVAVEPWEGSSESMLLLLVIVVLDSKVA